MIILKREKTFKERKVVAFLRTRVDIHRIRIGS